MDDGVPKHLKQLMDIILYLQQEYAAAYLDNIHSECWEKPLVPVLVSTRLKEDYCLGFLFSLALLEKKLEDV